MPGQNCGGDMAAHVEEGEVPSESVALGAPVHESAPAPVNNETTLPAQRIEPVALKRAQLAVVVPMYTSAPAVMTASVATEDGGEHTGESNSARRAVYRGGGSAHVRVCQYPGAYAVGASQ